MKKIYIFALATCFLGCKGELDKEQISNDVGFNYVQDIVKKELSDPESAQFRNQSGFCGELNSKNKFGGYVGFHKFVVINPQRVIIESEANLNNGQFEKLWKKTCSAKFQFSNKKIIPPNFEIPDAEYKKAEYHFGSNFATATPSSISFKNGTFVYPVLQIRCVDNETFFYLNSGSTISYEMRDAVAVETEIQKMELISAKDEEKGYQIIKKNRYLSDALKKAKSLKISFRTIDGQYALQEYDLIKLREGMRTSENSCNWGNV